MRHCMGYLYFVVYTETTHSMFCFTKDNYWCLLTCVVEHNIAAGQLQILHPVKSHLNFPFLFICV